MEEILFHKDELLVVPDGLYLLKITKACLIRSHGNRAQLLCIFEIMTGSYKYKELYNLFDIMSVNPNRREKHRQLLANLSSSINIQTVGAPKDLAGKFVLSIVDAYKEKFGLVNQIARFLPYRSTNVPIEGVSKGSS